MTICGTAFIALSWGLIGCAFVVAKWKQDYGTAAALAAVASVAGFVGTAVVFLGMISAR